MKLWKEYNGHELKIIGKRNKYDNTIFTFDIETTSYFILDGKQHKTIEYLDLSKEEQDKCIFMSTMYIWMFSVDDVVYYGRTWKEFRLFLDRLFYFGTEIKKYVYVHNLSYEFEFLRNEFNFKSVFSRKSRKVMKCELEDYNLEFRCSYFLTNLKLERLPEIYKLPIKKLVGNLNYSLIRHSSTKLTEKELAYCENDCLVVYEYIKLELKKYEVIKKIPLTSTGHVRKELKELIDKNYRYKYKVQKSINTDGHIYNLLSKAFAGGYTHANWIKANEIIKNVTSFDFTSSYPFVMLTEKYPCSIFRKCKLKTYEELDEKFCYIVKLKAKNIKCKYYNNFISQSKCEYIVNGRYDNGRIMKADEIEIILTDVDLKLIFETYEIESYEFEEIYWAYKNYLPSEFLKFVLDKYEKKTQYKNVEGKEIEYAIEKSLFNALYGLSVTNNIRDNVIFDNINWSEVPLTNEEIIKLLEKQKDEGFMSYSWGVFITAYARRNLIENLIKLDDKVLYADTDSLKLEDGFDISVIENYNKKVEEKIKNVCKDLELPIEKFKPKDSKGKEHCLGLFECESKSGCKYTYDEFITQGAKKYAYVDSEDKKIHITVSGVPKNGAKGLKSLKDFKDDFVFEYKYTNKNIIYYNDDQVEFLLTDYHGKKQIVNDKYGCCLLPTTYSLGKSEEYRDLISDISSKHAIFKEG